MDIQELRQFESVYKPSKEVAFCWLRKQYVQLSTEENHTEIVDHANYSLRIWQAAKSQAVPDLGELQERIAGHQYYHDEHGHMIVDMDDVVKEISGFDSWKAQAVPQWISTSERMPDEGEEVLVHSLGQVRQVTRDSKWAGGFKERNCYGWQAAYGQSHWMPKSIELPEQYHFYYENDAKQKAMIDEVSQ